MEPEDSRHLPSFQQPVKLVKLPRLVAISQPSCGQDVGLEPGDGREFQGVGNSTTARDRPFLNSNWELATSCPQEGPCHTHTSPFLDEPTPMPLISTSAFIEHLLYAMHWSGHWHAATHKADRALHSGQLDSNRGNNAGQVFPALLSPKELSHGFRCSVIVDDSWICLSSPNLSPECRLHDCNCFPDIHICISNKYLKLHVSKTR